MFGLGTTEILVIAVLLVVFFGAKRLPEIGEGLGKAIREFRNVKKDLVEEDGKEGADAEGEKAGASSLEGEMVRKVENRIMNGIPGARQAKKIKEGADRVKSLVR